MSLQGVWRVIFSENIHLMSNEAIIGRVTVLQYSRRQHCVEQRIYHEVLNFSCRRSQQNSSVL